MPRGKKQDAGEDTPENMKDGQTAPGFDEGESAATPRNVTSLARRRDEGGEQDTFVPPPPGKAQPGYINPPALEEFSNATYMRVSKQIDTIVDRTLKMDEFKALRGIPYLSLWRRKGTPTVDGDKANRQYVGIALMPPLVQYVAALQQAADFPHFVLNFYWLHFEELRKDEEGASFVPEKELERHVFFALRHVIASDSGVLSMRSQAGVEIWADVVKHYGLVTDPLIHFARQARLWSEMLAEG